jgi:hypothetical protein
VHVTWHVARRTSYRTLNVEHCTLNVGARLRWYRAFEHRVPGLRMSDDTLLSICRGMLRRTSRRTDASGFGTGDHRVSVVEVLDQWLAPDHRYFKLRGSDGDTYLVRHDVRTDRWELTMFQAGGAEA